MLKKSITRMERVGGSAMPATIANASQTGVKGIVSEALKQTFIKTCIMM